MEDSKVTASASNSDPVITAHNGKDRIPLTATLLSVAFASDPIITWILHSLTPTARRDYLASYFRALLKACSLNGASFESVGFEGPKGEGEGVGVNEWQACGVLMPPGRRVDNTWTMLQAGLVGVVWRLGWGGCQRMLFEYQPPADAAKAKALHGRKRYFYVFFLATHPESRRKGLCSALVREYQARAETEGVPLWLEATSEYSMKLYNRLGFRTVDEWVVGKGAVGPDGLAHEGGEGVRVWGMIWEAGEGKETMSSTDEDEC